MSFELKKMYSKKVIGLVISLLIINLLFLILFTYGPEQNVDVLPQVYKSVFRSMGKMDNKEKRDYLKEQNEKAEFQIVDENGYKRKEMLEQLLEDSEKIVNYESYLNELEEELGGENILGILSGDSTFFAENTEKMKMVYQSLHGIPVSFEPSKGIEMTDTTVTNIIMVFLIIFLSMQCLIQEKEDGILPILRCCKKGRGKLLAQKTGCIWSAAILLSLLFTLENLLFGAASYGVGNLFRPLQSLAGFETSPLKISVFLFLILMWLTRAFALFLIGMFVMLITVLTYQIAVICLGCLIVGGVSYGLFQSISIQSSMANFYYVNPVTLLKTIPLFRSEINLNILGNPVNPCLAAICTGIVICLLLIAVTFFLFVKTREEISISFSIKRKQRGRACAKNLAGEEAYKIWRTRKGFFLLLSILVIQMVQNPGERSDSPEEICENGYISQLSGEVTDEKGDWILKEWKRVSQEIDQGSQIKQQVLENRIQPLFEQLNARRENGEHAEFITQSGYRKMFGIDEEKVAQKNTMLYSIVIVVSCCLYVTMEKTSGMSVLIEATKNGWKRVRKTKQRQALLFSSVSMVVVWGMDMIWYVKRYGVSEWFCPISWITEFSSWNRHITIFLYILLLWGIRFAGGALLTLLVLFVSEKSKNSMESLVICMFLFVVPAVLAIIGVPGMTEYTFQAFLDGNVVLHSGYGSMIYMAVFGGTCYLACR